MKKTKSSELKGLPRLELHRYRNQDGLRRRVGELRACLAEMDPVLLAEKTGATLVRPENGVVELLLSVLNEQVAVLFPGLEIVSADDREPVALNTEGLVLYYFNTSDGAPPAGRWISFRELPGGGFYHQAFQGYTGHELEKKFGNDLDAFVRAAQALGGKPQEIGDAAFAFQALPQVPLLIVYWQGDDDFGPSVRMLFDASAGHHLPTDAFSILGSTLIRCLIALAN